MANQSPSTTNPNQKAARDGRLFSSACSISGSILVYSFERLLELERSVHTRLGMGISDDITIRASGTSDAGFLFGLYLERRAPELMAIGWSVDEIGSFLNLQYSLRRQAYEARYKNAVFYLIESNGRSVGELITSRTPEHILVIDIAISSEYLGSGFGSAAIRNLQAEAVEEDRSIILHVDRQNIGARKLYENLGFEIGADDDKVTLEMTWKLN